MSKTTISSIAKATGFSVSTVSRVLSGLANKYRISEETVAIIKKEAKVSNYTPSLIARSLRTRKTNTIGLVLPSIDNPFFANIASIIINEAKSKNYTIILADTLENEENEAECIESLTSRNIDGAIIIPCGKNVKDLEQIANQGVPVVLIDRFFTDTSLPYVSTDNYMGASMAMDHLINNGHQMIACIQGTPSTMPVILRVEGYKDKMQKHSLTEFITVVGNSFTIENGYSETIKLIKAENRPSAIFTLSNTITLGAYKAIKEYGLRIPEDISIVCFDNHLYLDYIEPRVTRIAQPIDEISTLATKILIDAMENKTEEKNIKDNQLLLPPSLILGNSVLKLSSSY